MASPKEGRLKRGQAVSVVHPSTVFALGCPGRTDMHSTVGRRLARNAETTKRTGIVANTGCNPTDIVGNPFFARYPPYSCSAISTIGQFGHVCVRPTSMPVPDERIRPYTYTTYMYTVVSMTGRFRQRLRLAPPRCVNSGKRIRPKPRALDPYS
jgi:hypothetical protein